MRASGVPIATVNPRTAGDHARVAASRVRGNIHRATVNAVTRSGWFVGVLGALLMLVVVFAAGYALEAAHLGEQTAREFGEIGIPYHDGPCAGKVSCPELNREDLASPRPVEPSSGR